MKNKSIDLHNHLFERLEALGDASLTGEKLQEEIKRSRATVEVSNAIIDNSRLALDAVKLARSAGVKVSRADLPMLPSAQMRIDESDESDDQ